MQQCQEERSQGQGVCQTLTRQAEECKISGEEADGAAGSPGISTFSHLSLIQSWEGAISKLY